MSPPDTQMHRDMGRMEAQIAALESKVETMQQQVADMHAVLMRAQGSWKMAVGAAGFGAAVVGLLSNLKPLLDTFRGHA